MRDRNVRPCQTSRNRELRTGGGLFEQAFRVVFNWQKRVGLNARQFETVWFRVAALSTTQMN